MLLSVMPYKAAHSAVASAFAQGNRNSLLSMIPQLSADTGNGFTLTASSLWSNPPYWQLYFPFKQDDAGTLVGVGDQADADVVTIQNTLLYPAPHGFEHF